MAIIKTRNTEAAILARVIRPTQDDLPTTAAGALLKFEFSEDDQKRMHELAVKNQAGKLTSLERQELDGYILVGRLDLIVNKARLSLWKQGHDA